MAPKRPSALDIPPSASPSSSEEESEDSQQPQNPSDDSDRESSEEEERETVDKPLAEKSDDEEDDDTVSEAGSDTESDTAPSEFTVKPVVISKPMTESPKPKKPSDSKSTPKQASAADVAEKKGKPNGKSPIVRLWTEESELAALRAMHEYRSKKGLDPYADTGAFFEFAKKTIPVEVTRNQVMAKLRRLRKKYENNVQNGDDPVFNKAHEHMAFEVSKKIWGGGAESSAKSAKRKEKRVGDSVEKESNKKAKKEKSLESVKDDANEIVVDKGVVGESLKVDDEVGFWDKYPRLKEAIEVENNGSFLKDGKKAMMFDLTKMGDAKAKELDDKWKRYQAKEAELKLLKLELVIEQTKLVLGELMKP